MDNLLSSIGTKIKKLRKGQGWTQAELAAKCDVSLRHLQNIEYGKVDLSISSLIQFSEMFNVSLNSFLERREIDNTTLTELDFLPVGLQVSDRNGLVLYTNQTANKYQGYTREDICRKMFIWDFVSDKKEKEDLKSYLKYLLKEQPKPVPYVSTNETKSGEKINVHCTWNYIYDDKKEIIGFVTTICYL